MNKTQLSRWLLVTCVMGAVYGIGVVTAHRWSQDKRVQGYLQGHDVNESTASTTGTEFQPQQPQAFLASLHGLSDLRRQALISNTLAEMSLEQVKAMVDTVRASAFTDAKSREVLTAIIARWAELDPDGLLKKAQMSEGGIHNAGIQAAFVSMARKDVTSAWQKAKEQNSWVGYMARTGVLQALAETDLSAAIKFAQEVGASDSAEPLDVSEAIGQWAGRDPITAAKAVAEMPLGRARSSGLSKVAEAWGHRDFDGAWGWAQAITSPKERQELLGQLIGIMSAENAPAALKLIDDPALRGQRQASYLNLMKKWAEQDWDGALKFSTNISSPIDRQSAFSSLARKANGPQREILLLEAKTAPPGIARAIYEGALYWASTLDDAGKTKAFIDQITIPSIKEKALSQMVSMMSYSTPDKAAQNFTQLQPSSQSANLAASICQGWAKIDPDKALAWANELSTYEQRKSALSGAIRSLTETDPKAAAARLLTISDSKLQAELIRPLAETWAQSDGKAALAWAQTLEPSFRTAALGKLVESALKSDPEQAQRLYAQFSASLTPEQAAKSDNKTVAAKIASNLAEISPSQAQKWIETLPDGGARDFATGGVVDRWAKYDPVAASEWITTLPAGGARDAAATSLVASIARDDPSSAWTWAVSLTDRTQRRTAVAQALDGWKANGEREVALEALQKGNFTDEERVELAKKLE
jgi:hypothetical protein